MSTWKRRRSRSGSANAFWTRLHGSALPLPLNLGCPGGVESSGELNASKKRNCLIFSAVVCQSRAPKFARLNLILDWQLRDKSKTNENSSLVYSKWFPFASAPRKCDHVNLFRGRNGICRGETVRPSIGLIARSASQHK